MLEAGCGYLVVPSFSSFFTATVPWVLAEELTQMGIISGNSQPEIAAICGCQFKLKLTSGLILKMTFFYYYFKTLFAST